MHGSTRTTAGDNGDEQKERRTEVTKSSFEIQMEVGDAVAELPVFFVSEKLCKRRKKHIS